MPLFRDGKCPPLRRWSEPAQIAGFVACALFANFLVGLLISPLRFTDTVDVPKRAIQSWGALGAFLVTTLVAPFFETIVGQWLPMLLAKFAKRPPVIRILWSSCFFSLLHLREGPSYMIQNFFVGWILASAFMFGSHESWIKAYRVTSITHAVHNLIVFIILLIWLKTMG